MVAKVMIENGYKPGKGIGHSLQGMANPIGAEKNGDRFGLGYKPTRKDKERIAAEKREIRLAKLEGRDPARSGRSSTHLCDFPETSLCLSATSFAHCLSRG